MGGKENEATDAAEKIEQLKITSSVKEEIDANGVGDDDDDDRVHAAPPGNLFDCNCTS